VLRVVFLGSPPFATPVLERLVSGPYRPVAVVTQPDRARGRSRRTSPVAELAEREDIPLLRPESARDPEFQDELRSLEPDVMMVASYGELLDDAFLAIPPRGSLNVHGSLLPRWRGASPIQAAILAGDEVTGVSVQRIVKKLDAGDVMLELETPIEADETAGELFARLEVLGAEAAERALEIVDRGEDEYTPQDPALVTHCRKIGKDAGAIDWSRSAGEIARLVRAMNPWPTARASTGGAALQVLGARVAPLPPGHAGAAPGTLVAANPLPLVATGEGALELVSVKPAGKREMDGGAWLRGARLQPGDVLEGATS
jgi:methionyl-tRNA formyltransferase